MSANFTPDDLKKISPKTYEKYYAKNAQQPQPKQQPQPRQKRAQEPKKQPISPMTIFILITALAQFIFAIWLITKY